MKKRYLISGVFLSLFLIYGLGPKPEFPPINPTIEPLSISLSELDNYIAQKESQVANIKPENEARIIWADSIQRTPYSIVYLHGFSASAKEGDPLHRELAEKYGCNLYLTRLAQHGIEDKETFSDLTPKALVDSAKEAIAIGKLLGEKVIVMSCSTGGTLSAYLAANNPQYIDAQLMYSPNFSINSSTIKLLTMPWGKELAYQTSGKYRQLGMPPNCYPYWTKEYRVEGIIALQALLDKTMNDKVFSKITQPTFLGYYYKSEEQKDEVISIDAIHHFYKTIQTPENEKWDMAFPDAGAHVFISDLQSKDLDNPRKETFRFMEEVVLKK